MRSDHGGRGEEPGPLERRATHRRRRVGVVDDRREGGGEGLRVAGRHQEPGHPIVDEIDDPPTGRGNDRPADGHRLEDHGRAAVGHDRGDHHDTGRLHQLDDRRRGRAIRAARRRPGASSGVSFELSSGQHERRQAAESPVRLEQHLDALVPTQVSDEHDRPVRMRGGLVEEKVVGNEVGDDRIGAPSRQLRVDRHDRADRDERVHVSGAGATAESVRHRDARADHWSVPRRRAADAGDGCRPRDRPRRRA